MTKQHKVTRSVMQRIENQIGKIKNKNLSKNKNLLIIVNEFNKEIINLTHKNDVVRILSVFGMIFIGLMTLGIIFVALSWV